MATREMFRVRGDGTIEPWSGGRLDPTDLGSIIRFEEPPSRGGWPTHEEYGGSYMLTSAPFVRPLGRSPVQMIIRGHSSEECAAKLQAELREDERKRALYAENPLAELEDRLKNHDWYAAMSDDYRVVEAGRRDWSVIEACAARCPPEEAQALIDRYRPKMR